MLSAGSLLGPYEILAPLGAGGMGEVYRARDPRMGRDVAVKILPAGFTEDPARLQRFEQEARAAGSLNHPNILVIHDVGQDEGISYLVSELLEGETLRERLTRGAIPLRKAIEYAMEIADGLGEAHDRGIIHRDLKPENVFLTSSERIKLLDFGLAKTIADAGPADSNLPTLAHPTASGVAVGTPAYMAPEQVRGEPVDERSDIFSFGILLAEMLTGRHPFQRRSSAETMHAIIHEDPDLDFTLPPVVTRMLEHTLEKNRSRRFQSLRDLAFALDAVTTASETTAPAKTRRARRSKTERRIQDVSYRRITYRRGFVMTARFAPDGSILYGAAWDGQPVEIFSSYPGNPESRPLGLTRTDLLDVSPAGDLAISLGRHYVGGWVSSGTLARRPLAGGSPRELCEKMQDADWSSDGKSLALIRRDSPDFVIEYPMGNEIYRSTNWISDVRISPRDDRLAFIEHPLWGDDAGVILVIDRQGNRLVQSPTRWSSCGGIAWTPKGDEIWIAAESRGAGRDIVAMSLTGTERLVLATTSRATLHDISPDGDVLVSWNEGRREIFGARRGQEETALTWFDWPFLCGLSSDGSRIVFEEQGVARRSAHNSIYLRDLAGSPAIYLGDGRARDISPDGKWLVTESESGESLQIIPTGAGQPRALHPDSLGERGWWYWFPDGLRLLVWGHEPGKTSRMFVLPIDGGDPRPIGTEGIAWPMCIAPDGSAVAARGPNHEVLLYPVSGDAPRPTRGFRREDQPIQWSDDGRFLFVYPRSSNRTIIDRVEIETGERVEWQEIRPRDVAGVLDIMPVMITRDGETYCYGFRRFLSELYVVRGLLD